MKRQATARISWSRIGKSLLFTVCLISTPILGASSVIKRSEAERDISLIGHRKIANRRNQDSSLLEMEKRIGAQWASNFEQSTPLLRDPATAAYVERLAHTVAQNSDTRFPITVRLIDSEEVYAFTLPAGYQY